MTTKKIWSQFSRRKTVFLTVLALLLITIVPVVTILYYQTSENFRKTPIVIKIPDARTGSFFFESETIIHIPYSHYDSESGSRIGWSTINYANTGVSTTDYFYNRTEIKSYLMQFSNVRGAISNDNYFLFSNGIDGFFYPGSMSLLSTDLNSWVHVSTYFSTTSTNYYSRFVGVMEDSNDTLVVCFSDIQGMITGYTNYTFYLLRIQQDDVFVEELSFDGELKYLGDAQFFIYDDEPVICWSFYDEILDLVTLKITLRRESSWLNYTLSYPFQDLFPCGFDIQGQSLKTYFYGLNYYGPSNENNYNGTTLYQAEILVDDVIPTGIFSSPELLHFPKHNIHHWGNGKLSMFFKKYTDFNTSACYGYYSNGELKVTNIQMNTSAPWVDPLQMTIKEDFIYLLWRETIPNYSSDEPYHTCLYFVRFPQETDFSLDEVISIEEISWINSSENNIALCVKRKSNHKLNHWQYNFF